MMEIKILFALFLSIVFISSAYAEEVMSLDEAVRAALSGNPALRAGQKGIDASKKDIDIARSYLLPKLTFDLCLWAHGSIYEADPNRGICRYVIFFACGFYRKPMDELPRP